MVILPVTGRISMHVDTNSERNAEDEKYSTEDLEPHPLLLLQVGHLDHDHHGEDPHDHPLHVADVKKVLDVGVILAGGEAGL